MPGTDVSHSSHSSYNVCCTAKPGRQFASLDQKNVCLKNVGSMRYACAYESINLLLRSEKSDLKEHLVVMMML